MVDRRKIDYIPVTVVDLDGTYIKGNSLIIYLSCGIKYLASRGKAMAIARILRAILLRKLGRYSHYDMKSIILSELFPYPEILIDFRREILKHINRNVRKLIDKNIHDGHRILLATAAPAYYVRSIWDGEFLASDFEQGKALTECVKSEKAKRVKHWIETHNCYIDTVLTDSIDDFELVDLNKQGTNILVNPSNKDLRTFRKLQPAHLFLIDNSGELIEA